MILMMPNAGEKGEREWEEYPVAQCRRFLPRHRFSPWPSLIIIIAVIVFISSLFFNLDKCDHCHHLSSILLLSLLLFISSLFFNLDKCDHRNSVVFSLQVEGCSEASSSFQLRQELSPIYMQQSVWNPDSGSVWIEEVIES